MPLQNYIKNLVEYARKKKGTAEMHKKPSGKYVVCRGAEVGLCTCILVEKEVISRENYFFLQLTTDIVPVTPSYQGTQPIITSHALSQSSAGFKIWLMQCMKVLPRGTALIHHRLMLRPKYKVHILVTDINVDFIQNWQHWKRLML